MILPSGIQKTVTVVVSIIVIEIIVILRKIIFISSEEQLSIYISGFIVSICKTKQSLKTVHGSDPVAAVVFVLILKLRLFKKLKADKGIRIIRIS
jgi:hypothetical protein